jgi:hypothetical protein
MASVLLDTAGDDYRGAARQRLLRLRLGHVGEEHLFEVYRLVLHGTSRLHKRLSREA